MSGCLLILAVAGALAPGADARCHPHARTCWGDIVPGGSETCVDDVNTNNVVATVTCIAGEDDSGEMMSMFRAQVGGSNKGNAASSKQVGSGATVVEEGEGQSVEVTLWRTGSNASTLAYDIHFYPDVDGIDWTDETGDNGTFAAGDSGPIELLFPYTANSTDTPKRVNIPFVLWDGNNGFAEGAVAFTVVPDDWGTPATVTVTKRTPGPALALVVLMIVSAFAVLAVRRGKF